MWSLLVVDPIEDGGDDVNTQQTDNDKKGASREDETQDMDVFQQYGIHQRKEAVSLDIYNIT